VIEVPNGEARQPAKVHGAFFRRSAGLVGGAGGEAGAVADFELDLADGQEVDGEGGARMRYTIPAATVLDRRLAKFLGWEGSPYQLVVSNDIGLPVAASAWTYFHVPSEWDVNTPRRWAARR